MTNLLHLIFSSGSLLCLSDVSWSGYLWPGLPKIDSTFLVLIRNSKLSDLKKETFYNGRKYLTSVGNAAAATESTYSKPRHTPAYKKISISSIHVWFTKVIRRRWGRRRTRKKENASSLFSLFSSTFPAVSKKRVKDAKYACLRLYKKLLKIKKSWRLTSRSNMYWTFI